MYDIQVLKNLCNASDLEEVTQVFDDFEMNNHKKMLFFKIRENLGDLRLSGDITEKMMQAGMKNVDLYDQANKTVHKVNVSDDYLKSLASKIEDYYKSEYLSIYTMPGNTMGVYCLLNDLKKHCPEVYKEYRMELENRKKLAVKKLMLMGELVNQGYPCNNLLYYMLFNYEPYHLHKLQSQLGKEYMPVKKFVIRGRETYGIDLAGSYDTLRDIEHIYAIDQDELDDIVDFMQENSIPPSRNVLYEIVNNHEERVKQYNSLVKEKSLLI